MLPFAEFVQSISQYFSRRDGMKIPDAVREQKMIENRIMAAWVRGDISGSAKETLLDILREGKKQDETEFKC